MRHKFACAQLAIHELFILNLLLVASIVVVTLLISHYFPVTRFSSDLLLPMYRGDALHPKPVERRAFLFCSIVVFLFSLSFIKLKSFGCSQLLSIVRVFYSSLIPVLLGMILAMSLLGSFVWDHVSWAMGARSFFNSFVYLTTVFIATILFVFCLIKFDLHLQKVYYYINKIKWWIFISISLLLLFAWRIVSIYSITQSSKFFVHLDATIYPLSQVVQGKTILVDLPSQYGLFPEILAPIFKFTELTVLSFTLFMGLLQILSLLALFIVINKVIKNQIVVLLGVLSLTVITFGNFSYLSGVGDSDPYFQYWPIRFFWPALSVYCFYSFIQKKTFFKSAVISITSAIAIIWNADTGVFIFISYGVYLSTRIVNEFFSKRVGIAWKQRKYTVALVLHLMISLITIVVFFAYLQISSGKALNYSWLYKYQTIFYLLGFGMIPIPTKLDPWMGVISIYMYGLISSLFSWGKTPSRKSELVLYLSLLGMGLFVYYEGRAHPFNLMYVMWPSVILGMIFLDIVIRCVKLKLIGIANIIPVSTFLTFVIGVNFLLSCKITSVISDIQHNLFGEASVASPVVLDELKFIKKHSSVGQSCVILTLRQGIYYAEAGLSSPIVGPGFVEILLKSDADNFTQQFQSTRPNCVFLGINKSGLNLGFNYVNLLSDYKVIDENKSGTIYFLQLK